MFDLTISLFTSVLKTSDRSRRSNFNHFTLNKNKQCEIKATGSFIIPNNSLKLANIFFFWHLYLGVVYLNFTLILFHWLEIKCKICLFWAIKHFLQPEEVESFED